MFGPLTSRDALFDVSFRHQTPRLTPPNVSLWRARKRSQIWVIFDYPDLRIHMHSDEDGNDFERAASMHWWHARCGHDWWDFVFFAPPPEDYIF